VCLPTLPHADQRIEGTLGLSLTGRAQISFLFFRIGIEIFVSLIEGYLSTTGTSDEKQLNFYSSGIGARTLRSHGKLWIQLGVSIWYPCNCRWSGWWFKCDNCYWTSWAAKWNIDLFNSEGFNIAGSHHNIKGKSGPDYISGARRLEEVEGEGADGEEFDVDDATDNEADEGVVFLDASEDKDVHLVSSIVEVNVLERMEEHCVEGTECGSQKLADGLTGGTPFCAPSKLSRAPLVLLPPHTHTV